MKEIKDYLHLYLGCELERGGIVTERLLHEARNAAFDIWSDLKPILRSLSDMSEEEKMEYHRLLYRVSTKDSIIPLQAEAIRYLLSKHFDLFGLIEAGLAIDATTIKNQTK